MKVLLPLVITLALMFSGAESRAAASSRILYGQPVSKVDRDPVVSPDGASRVVVRDDAHGVPYLTLERTRTDIHEQLFYVQRSGWVLWRPDSRGFGFTDAAYANHYFLKVCEVKAGSRAQCNDLSPLIEGRFRTSLEADHAIDKLYAKCLKWISNSILLVGLHAVIFKEPKRPTTYISVEWRYHAYLVDVTSGKILEEPGSSALRKNHGITLSELEW